MACKYSRENFCGALENCEKRESLAQRIFPHLRYSYQHDSNNSKVYVAMLRGTFH